MSHTSPMQFGASPRTSESAPLSQREMDHVKTIRKLCRMLMQAQQEEDTLLAEVHRTLTFDVLQRTTPQHKTSPDTVDSRSAWGRWTTPSPTVHSPQRLTFTDSNQSMSSELEQLRRQLALERAKNQQLETDVVSLRRAVAQLSSKVEALDRHETPRRPISNILLRDSTQKLLREAEEELFRENDFSFQQ